MTLQSASSCIEYWSESLHDRAFKQQPWLFTENPSRMSYYLPKDVDMNFCGISEGSSQQDSMSKISSDSFFQSQKYTYLSSSTSLSVTTTQTAGRYQSRYNWARWSRSSPSSLCFAIKRDQQRLAGSRFSKLPAKITLHMAPLNHSLLVLPPRVDDGRARNTDETKFVSTDMEDLKSTKMHDGGQRTDFERCGRVVRIM